LDDFDLYIEGIPDTTPEVPAGLCRSRLLGAVRELLPHVDAPELMVRVGTEAAFRRARRGRGSVPGSPPRNSPRVEADEPNPDRYSARLPLYSFDQLVLPSSVLGELVASIEVLRVETRVFEDWGLRRIEPYPRTALNFHGPPGTGKTLAAHALAHRLERRILVASYAEIESKFHGDGPKNVKAIFQAAERDDSLLFIDEADSLLSQRLTNVTQGSEQAINSMRSQLLICLEQFHGIVVFSTNLVENYDRAFETRVRHVHFPMPDEDGRRQIWAMHLVDELPLREDVDVSVLASRVDDICGRDIKNAVIDAAVRAAVAGAEHLALADLMSAVERIKAARIRRSRPLTNEEKDHFTKKLVAATSRADESTGRTSPAPATPADPTAPAAPAEARSIAESESVK